MNRLIVAFSLLLLGAMPAGAEDAKQAFPRFCEEWMGKLAAREKRNSGMIQWENVENTVLGSYIGYSQQHTCAFKEDSGPTPIGKITYLEVRYEKRGANRAEAEHTEARPVETTEVTEIFRFSKGQWVY